MNIKIIQVNKVIIVFFVFLSFGYLNAQKKSSELTYENALLIKLSDFDGVKQGEKKLGKSHDGKKIEMTYDKGEKSIKIEHNGKMVRHGTNYVYDIFQYEGENNEYLREISNYEYGKKHGQSEVFFIYKKKRYLKENLNYVNGLRDGDYVRWNPKGNIYISGQFSNDIETGIWKYYHPDESIQYIYDYKGKFAVRTQYLSDMEAANFDSKQRKQSVTNFTYYNSEGKGVWKMHGAYIWYDGNGKEIQTNYYTNGNEVDYDKYVDYVNKEELKLNFRHQISDQDTREILKLFFDKIDPDFINRLGSITVEDKNKALKYLNEVLKQTCAMNYFEILAINSVSPVRSVKVLIEQLTKEGLSYCDKEKKYQLIVTRVSLIYKSELIGRIHYGNWQFD